MHSRLLKVIRARNVVQCTNVHLLYTYTPRSLSFLAYLYESDVAIRLLGKLQVTRCILCPISFSPVFWPYFYNLLFLSVSDHQLFFSSHAKKCRQSKINNIRTCLPNHMYATRDCRTKIRDMQTFIINSSSAELS